MITRIGAILLVSTFSMLSGVASQTVPEGVSATPPAPSLDLIAQGEALYERRCTACHSLDHNRIGPKHRGVYGRKAGAVPDFRYSKALRALDIVWTEETLDAWLENPPAFAPGTSMGFRLNNPDQRWAIITYLRSISED